MRELARIIQMNSEMLCNCSSERISNENAFAYHRKAFNWIELNMILKLPWDTKNIIEII